MRSGNLVSGPGFAFIVNGGHSSIGGADYHAHYQYLSELCRVQQTQPTPADNNTQLIKREP